MSARVILISEDKNFFEYIIPILPLRKCDELYRIGFDDIAEKFQYLKDALLIINSENKQAQTLELLNIAKEAVSVVFAYNNDTEFKMQGYKSGMAFYISLSEREELIRAKLLPAFRFMSYISKHNIYRELLVENKLIEQNNEVFLNPDSLLDKAIENIHKKYRNAVLGAISPDKKTNSLVSSNQIETIILNKIREDDLLIKFAKDKYFLLLNDITLKQADSLWEKISAEFSEPVFAGFAAVNNRSRQILVNEALSKLHEAMHRGFKSSMTAEVFSGENFNYNKNKFRKKIKQVILPTFYRIQQLYNNKLFNMKIEFESNDNFSIFKINSDTLSGKLKITCPGYSAVNVDITYKNTTLQNKHITLEPDELEAGLLQDILEQFINELKKENEVNYENVE